MKHPAIFFVAALMIFIASSCAYGYASLVRRDLYGGTLALHGHHETALEDARRQMAEHCRGPYTVVAEENVVVGEQTQSSGSTSYFKTGTSSSGTTTTRGITEYRVTYQCGTMVPPPATPPATPPQGTPPSPAPPQ